MSEHLDSFTHTEKQNNTAENEEDETTSSRFVIRLIKYLLKGFEAKDKNVRFRVLQLMSEIIRSISAPE